MSKAHEALRIVRAEDSDLEPIVELMEEAATWISSFDIKQWPIGFIRENPGIITRRIAEHEVYVARIDGTLAATMTIQWSDPAVWGRCEERAGYLHGLVVGRSFAGRHLGHEMLRWAEERVRSQQGHFLRLDCVAANPRLRRYYTDYGFTFVREKQMKGDDWRALFEKTLR